MADEANNKTPPQKAAQGGKVRKKPYLIAGGRETAALENAVNKLVLQGYKPHGSMLIQIERDEPYYYQPMLLHGIFK